MRIQDEEQIKDYYDLRKQLDSYAKNVQDIVTLPNYCLSFMQPGRLVKVRHLEYDFGWGVVVNFKKRYPHRTQSADMKPQELYIIDALINVAGDPTQSNASTEKLPPGVRPPPAGDPGRMETVPLVLSCVEKISSVRLTIPKELRDAAQRQTVQKYLQEVKRRFPNGIACLDPKEDMNIRDDGFKKLLRVRSQRFHSWDWLMFDL